MSLQNLESIAFYMAFAGYFLAMIFYVLLLPLKNNRLGQLARYTAILGLVGNTIAILLRMGIAGRPPLANGYEFVLVFAWGIIAVYLWVESRYKAPVIGAFILPLAFFLLAFVVLFMSNNERVLTNIQPALRSNWLTFHVLTAMIGYGALAISFGVGVLYLIKQRWLDKGTHSNLSTRTPDLGRLDLIGYKMIMLGFPMLTLCIITGAIWANIAWGSYWSWDPKETWSLITWMIYAVYLHVRLMHGWKGKPTAWVAVIGFLAVLFTFFGVNYFVISLHSYA
ncbi:MAG TPA: c-type cytochrome biogenesis protein CcsB [Desulfitobacterium dehalogenans]|uniref:C-type cytochrome biogenesis protein CcsB n=1 Tax=Desulfitobacterium dehalogenans TaxID=36854 RepID=A0A7C7D4G5_9FIRM|nr:c-type cytochrome biogenesis protein CcsB [Desulfitobacterium dehalogenans]